MIGKVLVSSQMYILLLSLSTQILNSVVEAAEIQHDLRKRRG
jgi:hypothetical protein